MIDLVLLPDSFQRTDTRPLHFAWASSLYVAGCGPYLLRKGLPQHYSSYQASDHPRPYPQQILLAHDVKISEFFLGHIHAFNSILDMITFTADINPGWACNVTNKKHAADDIYRYREHPNGWKDNIWDRDDLKG